MVDYYLFDNEDSGDESSDEEKKFTLAARHVQVNTFLLAPFFFGYCTQ